MKALNVLVTIGKISISHKGVKELNIKRNFSDVSNSFSLVFLDAPEVSNTDLELYMSAGNRTITISYFDNTQIDKMIKFEGQVYDYTSTFVGSIKELTITGYVSRSIGNSVAGEAKYNIDFNNYYNLRQDETVFWGALKQLQYYSNHVKNDSTTLDDGTSFFISPGADRYNSAELADDNSLRVRLTGPTGRTLDVPIPDSFFPFREEEEDEEGDIVVESDSSSSGPWGKLSSISSLVGSYRVQTYNDANDKIRAFESPFTGEMFIQANPNKEYYGAGTFLYNGMGVRPSDIVRKLAHLEGWDYDNGNIVDTEFVPCSDKLKIQNMTALQFIQEVLVPMSITPSGTYTLAEAYYDEKNMKYYAAGEKITMTKGFAGFVPYFKGNTFYYEPLNSEMLKTVHEVGLGYNTPNSKVISFQVNTKGTVFYTEQSVVTNSLSIVTGEPLEEVVVATDAFVDEYNKTKVHNENLDNFFGFTYEEIDERVNSTVYKNQLTSDNQSMTGLVGIGDWFSTFDKDYVSGSDTFLDFDNYSVVKASESFNKNFITNLPSSGEISGSDATTSLTTAYEKIKQFSITATMSMYGDISINPGDYVQITIMVKSGTDLKLHPASGKYLVQSQQDVIGQTQFVQTLSLFRSNDLETQISPQKIDWSTDISADLSDNIINNR